MRLDGKAKGDLAISGSGLESEANRSGIGCQPQDNRISPGQTAKAPRRPATILFALACACFAFVGCHASRGRVTTFGQPTTADATAEFRKLKRLERLNFEVMELLPLPSVKVGHIGQRGLTARQYYLSWDRPYAEDPTNRYEVWMTTNLVDWLAITNTRFGQMLLDTKQYPQAFFKIRTAIYSTLPDGSVNWDGPVIYSDWCRKWY